MRRPERCRVGAALAALHSGPAARLRCQVLCACVEDVDPASGVAAARTRPELRRFELRSLRIPIGREVLPLVVPDAAAWRRQGEWIDGLRRGGEPPYWSRVWRSSVALARLVQRWPGLEGVDVCDLGCGLGLPGIVAARAGARVAFVDRQAEALAFARWNAVSLGGTSVSCVQGDWNDLALSYGFAVMLLADVSYRAAHQPALHRLVDSCLEEHGAVLHADPHREASTAFLRRLADRMAVATAERKVALAGDEGMVRLCVAAPTDTLLRMHIGRLPVNFSWTDGVIG